MQLRKKSVDLENNALNITNGNKNVKRKKKINMTFLFQLRAK